MIADLLPYYVTFTLGVLTGIVILALYIATDDTSGRW